MENTLHSETAPSWPELEAQGRPIAAAPDIAAQIRQSEAASETANEVEQSYFFRGLVIFMAIAAVFWVAVLGLFHLI